MITAEATSPSSSSLVPSLSTRASIWFQRSGKPGSFADLRAHASLDLGDRLIVEVVGTLGVAIRKLVLALPDRPQ